MRRIFYFPLRRPRVLQLEHLAIPHWPRTDPGPVAGCGVNPIDFKTRSGLGFVSQTSASVFIFVPGYDVSGVVDALSDGVSQWAPGDAVYGMVNFPLPAGACAEYVVADAGTWARAPQSPLAHAGGCRLRRPHCGRRCSMWVACNPVSGFWCWRVRARCRPSFCSACCMERRQREAPPASPANHDFLRRHGAALALDYRDPVAVGQHGPGSDSGSDGRGGGRTGAGLAGAEWPHGDGAHNTAAQLLEKASGMARKVLAIKVQPDIAQLAQLATLVDNGQLRLHVSAALALEEAASAHEKMQQGHVKES